MSLAVGSIGETVKVEGVTPLLSTESAVLGTVVNSNEMDKLPLAIRNWDDLLAMVPGVQSDRYTEQAGGTSAGRTGGVSVHGNRSLQNNFLLDGVANNSFSTNVQELTTQLSRPSVDAIDEFKVVTSPYAAEYGWSPGAAIIVSTKSGTNTLPRHGVRLLSATIDWTPSTTSPRPPTSRRPTNKQNQFGGNVGGPLMRNRAFFFADYEGTRLEQGVLRTGNVMTADSGAASSRPPIRDPLTGQPFPNNTIPDQSHRSGRRDHHGAGAAAATPPAPNNFIRQPNVEDESDRYLGARRHADRQRQQPVRPLHRQQPLPLRAGLVWRRARRHLDVGLGPELPRLARGGRRLEQGARLEPGERVARVVRARHQRRQAGSVRPERHGADRLQGRARRSDASPAASSASTSTATSASARRTSCRSSSTPARCSG